VLEPPLAIAAVVINHFWIATTDIKQKVAHLYIPTQATTQDSE
jgi:hypothetical protein